jgi:hypothetical protein
MIDLLCFHYRADGGHGSNCIGAGIFTSEDSEFKPSIVEINFPELFETGLIYRKNKKTNALPYISTCGLRFELQTNDVKKSLLR